MWYPHLRSDAAFVAMTVNVCRAICAGAAALLKRNAAVQFVHIDTCEFHTATHESAEATAPFGNLRRFLFHDLITGRVNAAHPLADYLARYGFTPAGGDWFRENATAIHILGLDYYVHSELQWSPNQDSPSSPHHGIPDSLRGFAAIAQEYVNRYQVPIMLGETNLRGAVSDRLTWLKLMEEQCEALVAANIDFRGFCWSPQSIAPIGATAARNPGEQWIPRVFGALMRNGGSVIPRSYRNVTLCWRKAGFGRAISRANYSNHR